MTEPPLLYLAGPYTHPDPVVNTRAAILAGMVLVDEGVWTPIIPHLSLLAHLVDPRPIELWYGYDIQLLAHCAGIVRLPGASSGADAELAYAEAHDITVVDFTDLPTAARIAWEGRLQ